MAKALKLKSEGITVPDSLEAANRLFYECGWTDGLPIIPPTKERVLEMLAGTDRDPQDVVACVAPQSGEATVEKIAINAVMAGCLPEYLPVVLTAIEAMAEEPFNLSSIQATTHPCAPLVIVNGPLAKKLDINCGCNAFGQGWRANATIGRAIRLVLLNVGGGTPGTVDRSTQGQPGKYTYCIAENEAESPWVPLHVERGFAAEESTVTVTAAEGPHNINDHESITGKSILTTVAGTMAITGSNNTTYMVGEPLLALGVEHATTIASDGFSKDDIKTFIFDNARIPIARFSPENIARRKQFSKHYGEPDENTLAPITKSREDIMVIVVGGAGKHSSWMPTFGMSRSVTKAIR